MAELDGYGDVRPDWLRNLARRSRARSNALEVGQHAQRQPRVRTLIRAVIGSDGQAGLDVIVRNVSPGGMCIASRTLLPDCGETLHVALPGQGDLKAVVRWVGDGEFGVQLMGGLDVGHLRKTTRRRNAGFAAALERVLGIKAHVPRGSTGLRTC